MASVFDVVHDANGTTAEYAGKDKFSIHEWSYDLVDGRADTVGVDNGKDKIDTFEWTGMDEDINSPTLLGKFIDGNNKPEYDFNFVFLHLKGPDRVGHSQSWNSVPWDEAVKAADARLGTVLAMVEDKSNKAWYGNTLIVITADHGGINYAHAAETDPNNYRIPFGVWGHLIPHGNPYSFSDNTRVDPNDGRPDYNAACKPIRHADGVDLGLNLMGLPAIDGASIKGMSIR
jgi:predicted AlkP superfamily pyrophosphatase or phosphodiesterase